MPIIISGFMREKFNQVTLSSKVQNLRKNAKFWAKIFNFSFSLSTGKTIIVRIGIKVFNILVQNRSYNSSSSSIVYFSTMHMI